MTWLCVILNKKIITHSWHDCWLKISVKITNKGNGKRWPFPSFTGWLTGVFFLPEQQGSSLPIYIFAVLELWSSKGWLTIDHVKLENENTNNDIRAITTLLLLHKMANNAIPCLLMELSQVVKSWKWKYNSCKRLLS